MCFLQKTALNLVKCGLHSRTYYFLPHIGGSHPVLYFTIQATEKYSNSNVLLMKMLEMMLLMMLMIMLMMMMMTVRCHEQ